MKILITGGTGMIGKELGKELHRQGHQLVILTRSIEGARASLPFPASIYSYQDNQIPPEALDGIEVIYNLAGENIGEGRWSSSRKKRLYDSRIKLTKNLVDSVKSNHSELKKFISVSAIGIYGDQVNNQLSENSPLGSDFLAKICKDWEEESKALSSENIEVINPRIGIVLSSNGGALDKLLPLFRGGMGSAVGDGKQWMSWIHLKDLVSLLVYLLDSKLTGPVNAVAPHPVTNMGFSKILAKVLSKNLFPKVPAFALKLVLGEMATLVLASQKVSSKKIQDDGFIFNYSYLEEALEDITATLNDGEEEFMVEQWIPKKPEDIFNFFCDEKNLERITPKFLKFQVLKKSTEAIEEETIIDYRLSLHGISMNWKTKIIQWNPPHQFVDVQLKGPYQSWNHTHELIPSSGGTLLRDKVVYKLPLGLIGRVVAGQKVKKDVAQIFKYRREYIAREFYH